MDVAAATITVRPTLESSTCPDSSQEYQPSQDSSPLKSRCGRWRWRPTKRTIIQLETVLGTIEIYACSSKLSDEATAYKNETTVHIVGPWWLTSRRFSASRVSTPYESTLGFSVGRVVSNDSEIYKAVKRGDVQLTRRLFVEGRASPRDTHLGYGSLLLVSDTSICSELQPLTLGRSLPGPESWKSVNSL